MKGKRVKNFYLPKIPFSAVLAFYSPGSLPEDIPFATEKNEVFLLSEYLRVFGVIFQKPPRMGFWAKPQLDF